MSKLKKFAILAFLLSAVFLAGCGRSDVVLTVHDNGSFTANITYGINKALMGNEEVKEQVKSLITDALDQNNIPYVEGETDELITISVVREFEDIKQLTSSEGWKGISMVPGFSLKRESGSLWTRIENGMFKIDGTLDAETFGAKEFIEQNGELSNSFGGSLKINTDSDVEGESWGGSGGDSAVVSFVSEKLSVPKEMENIGLEAPAVSQENASDGEAPLKDKTNPAGIIAAVILLIAAIAAAIVFAVKKNKKVNAEGSVEAHCENNGPKA